MTAHRVLFVDDEIQILNGLKRSLRSMRKDWEMQFETSARAALDEVAAERYDVIVTDMKMPEMDGVSFLKEVTRLSPSTIRIILSGEADKSSIMVTSAPIFSGFGACPIARWKRSPITRRPRIASE